MVFLRVLGPETLTFHVCCLPLDGPGGGLQGTTSALVSARGSIYVLYGGLVNYQDKVGSF